MVGNALLVGGGLFDHPVIGGDTARVAQVGPKRLPGPIIVDTIKPDRIVFDPAKSEANARSRGLPFSLVQDEFDWSTAQVIEDVRRAYGEPRYRAFGYIGDRLHVVAFTPREGALRIISLRKANRREERRYGTKTEPGTD